ncbi:MAG: helix-turn-helix transcriptional regulator [Clostridia bacterium]|nr:helix-turn-helix transcriptional regulator [Clostridia bacterium]
MIKHQPDNSRKNYHYNAYIYTGVTWHSHFHGNYELIYVMEGNISVTLNGESFGMEAGELLLISPYVVHGFVISAGSRAWVGVFSDEYVSAFAAAHAQTQFSHFRCDEKLITQLRNQLFFEGQPDQFLCMALLYSVCDACLKNASPLQIRSDATLIRRIIDYISENLDNDITLDDLAKHLGYEYHYFSAVFHQCFGIHFKKFLNIFRVEKAYSLLLKDGRDITEIYRACGFSGLRNFNRVFKAVSGFTPTEYRRSRRTPSHHLPAKT